MMEKSKRHCPTCRYEYESWIEQCPDCGTLVVEDGNAAGVGRASLDPGDDPQWTIVTNVPNAIIGSLIKSQLEDAGIPVLINRSPSVDIGEFSHNDYVPHDLRVPRARWDEARSLVDSKPEPALPLFDGGSWTRNDDPGVPEGWSLLPTAEDIQERERLMRAGGAVEADEAGAWRVYRKTIDADAEPKSCVDQGGGFAPSRKREQEWFEEDDYAGEATGTQRWVKVFYGILLLAISLPFLLQLFGQLSRIFLP